LLGHPSKIVTKRESLFRLSVLGGFYLDGKLGNIQRDRYNASRRR
jgi:hypothetical protein